MYTHTGSFEQNKIFISTNLSINNHLVVYNKINVKQDYTNTSSNS